MKFLPQALLTICALVSVASAAELDSKAVVVAPVAETKVEAVAETKTQTRRLDDPWDSGTKVYNEFPGEGWWSGTITSFNQATGMYTVTWEDGSTDYYDDGDKIDQMVANAQNDPQNNPAGSTSVSGAYPAGTAVSVFEDGEWWDGVVDKYESGTYTIKWDEDGEIEQIEAGAIMDQMVQDAFGDDDAVPDDYATSAPTSEDTSTGTEGSTTVVVGAAVSWYDEEGGWVDGTITKYANNVYTVTWEDGTTDEYDDDGDDFDELAQAILNAFGDDDAAPVASDSVSSTSKFPVGTALSDWEDGEWVDGEVVAFRDGSYIVKWDDEDDVEYYDSHDAEDMQELAKMADEGLGDDDAPPDSYFLENDLWQIGTPVAVKEDGILWYGEIDGFSHGEYSIAWDNGESEWIDDSDLVNTMVSNAALQPKKKGSKVGKAFLSLFLIAVCGVGSVYGYGYYQKRQAEQKRDRELALEDARGSGFRDQPDNLPKII